MYCTDCGNTLPDGAAFCPECGSAVGTSSRKPKRQPRSRGWSTFALCLLFMFLMIVGEVIGYVVGMGLGLDVDTSATVGGAVVSVLAVVVLGGGRLLVPTRAAMLEAFRTGWWLLAVNFGLAAFDLASVLLDESFVVAPGWPLRVLNVAVLCLAVGLSEELVFRGLLLHGFLAVQGGTRRGMVAAVVTSSLLFGIVHIDWSTLDVHNALQVGQAVLKVLQTGVFGLLMAAITLSSRSVIGPALLHAISDFLLMVTYVGLQGESTDIEYVAESETEAWGVIMLYGFMILLYVPFVVKAVRMVREHPVPDHGALRR